MTPSPAPTRRIVHLVSSLRGGGMEQFVLRLADLQRRRGAEATVLAITGGALEGEAARRRVPVQLVAGGTRVTRVMRVCAHLAARQPHIVHVHNPTVLHFASLSRFVGSARLVFTDHAQTRGIVRVGRPEEWRRVQACIAVSAATARRASDIGYDGEPEVIHNGIELPPPAPTRGREEVRHALGVDDRPMALHVAGFHPVKGHDLLLRALARLRSRGVALTVVCVGDGDERPRIEALARELGLGATQVVFAGFRHDVPDLMTAADFCVLPSHDEGFPMVLLEAMAYGLPPVCTAVGGNPELVAHEANGLLVAPGEESPLADAMERMTLDAALRRRLGEAGRAHVTARFTMAQTADQYDQVYQRVLAGGDSSRSGGRLRDPEHAR